MISIKIFLLIVLSLNLYSSDSPPQVLQGIWIAQFTSMDAGKTILTADDNQICRVTADRIVLFDKTVLNIEHFKIHRTAEAIGAIFLFKDSDIVWYITEQPDHSFILQVFKKLTQSQVSEETIRVGFRVHAASQTVPKM